MQDFSRLLFDRTFCSSPWFHMRINPQGDFIACRWRKGLGNDLGNIRDRDTLEAFQQGMAGIRAKMLQGQPLSMCDTCYHMEQHGKISGRQKQLLKTGIRTDNFVKTMRGSNFFGSFRDSFESYGQTDLVPQDWQIDLGNFCNSSCLFCRPESSSRLALEHQKLGLIQDLPAANWADDPELVRRFCALLESSENLTYLHFLGGETLITPAFKTILQSLIRAGMTNVPIGFTTNLTVWPEDVVDLLLEFSECHVGLSIECLHPVNDYLRWPSSIDQVRHTLDRWIKLAHAQQWYIQIRPTPNCLSILHVDTVYQYAFDHGASLETCNFLHSPEFMKINALNPELMQMAQARIKDFLDRNPIELTQQEHVNTRFRPLLKQQVWNDAKSYHVYLSNEQHDSTLAPRLVDFLKIFERHRDNKILDYLPEYESFLRSAGY